MEYLGFQVICDSVKPIYKIQAKKYGFTELPKGSISVYRCSNLLLWFLVKTLTYVIKLKWTEIEQYAFDEIKWIVARNSLSSYLYFNKQFKVYTNASNFQLGAVIIQKGRPMAFYTRRLNDAQKSYTVTEREILRIV